MTDPKDVEIEPLVDRLRDTERVYVGIRNEAAAEIERLTRDVESSDSTIEVKDRHIDMLRAERDRLMQRVTELSYVEDELREKNNRLRAALDLARNLPECPPVIRALADDALRGAA